MRLLDCKLYYRDIEKALGKTDLCYIKGKTVAITGGLGLIGSTIVDLLYTSHLPSLIYVFGLNKALFDEKYGDIQGVEFIEYDALESLNLDIQLDFIIHGAGLSSPELYISKPVETVLTNINGILQWLEFAKKHLNTRLLYISSSEVYGNKTTSEPFKEGIYGTINIDSIRSSYSIAKRASEMLCKSFASEYGVNVVMVRPGHIYGPSASPKDKRISSDFAYKAAVGEDLIMKSPGLQKRSYCYSVDCAVQILTVLLKGASGEVYNIGHDDITSIREMAGIIAKAGNVNLLVSEPTEDELNAFNPMNNSSLDNSKVKELGYRDTFSVKEGLTHTVYILKECLITTSVMSLS